MYEIIHYLDILGLIITALYYFILARFIYSQNRNASGNQAFSGMVFTLALLSVLNLIIVLNTRPEWLIYLCRIAPALGAFIVAFFFCFAWVYPQEKKISIQILILIFLPAVLLAVYSLFTDLMVKKFEIIDPVYIYIGKRVFGPAHLFLMPYEIFLILGGVILTLFKSFRLKGINRQKVQYVSVALFLGGVAGVTFSVLLPRFLNLPQVFSLGPIASAFGITMIAYAISKYKMFIITPKVAASEILNSLASNIAVCDTNNNLLYKGVEILKINEEERLKIVEAVIRKGTVKGWRIMIEDRPYVVSARLFKRGGGVIIVLHDLSLLEKEEEKENKIRKDLEDRLKKEKRLRDAFRQLASDFSVGGIEEILASAKADFADDIEAYRPIEEMAKLTRERNRLFFEARQDREALEKRLEAIKSKSEESVQKEMKMASIKELIEKSKKKK